MFDHLFFQGFPSGLFCKHHRELEVTLLSPGPGWVTMSQETLAQLIVTFSLRAGQDMWGVRTQSQPLRPSDSQLPSLGDPGVPESPVLLNSDCFYDWHARFW